VNTSSVFAYGKSTFPKGKGITGFAKKEKNIAKPCVALTFPFGEGGRRSLTDEVFTNGCY